MKIILETIYPVWANFYRVISGLNGSVLSYLLLESRKGLEILNKRLDAYAITG